VEAVNAVLAEALAQMPESARSVVRKALASQQQQQPTPANGKDKDKK
jgi:hypothetical protein